MEPLMYGAIYKMVTEKTIDEEVIKNQRSVDLWKKRLAMFTMKKDKPMWKEKVVPTIEDLEQVLRPIHWNQGKKHCIDIRCKYLIKQTVTLKPGCHTSGKGQNLYRKVRLQRLKKKKC